MAKTIAVAEETSTGLQQLKSLPERISSFLKDVRSEMRKVIWPARAEVQSTTIVVLVTVFIFAAYFWLVDNIIGRSIEADDGANRRCLACTICPKQADNLPLLDAQTDAAQRLNLPIERVDLAQLKHRRFPDKPR